MCTAAVQSIYEVLQPTQEDHHKEIESLNTIMQGMQKNGYYVEGLTQVNVVLTIYNSTVMAQLEQMTEKMNVIEVQLNNLFEMLTNNTIPKRKQYCWI